MTTRSIAEELRARLRGRHAALQQMGQFYWTSKLEPAWWRATSEPSADCRFLSATTARPQLQQHDEASDSQSLGLQESAEALVLLNALGCVDTSAFEREVHCVWPPNAVGTRAIVRRDPRDDGHPWAIGIDYCIRTPADVARVCERIVGETSASEPFKHDYAWLTSAVFTLNGESELLVPTLRIPVRMYVYLNSRRAEDLAVVLRKIAQSMTVQHLQQGQQDADCTPSARFRIVEVDLGQHSTIPLNTESLESLATLAHLGVRMPSLPSIRIVDAARQDPLPITKALQAILPASASASSPSPRVKHVEINELISSKFLPALFSSIQASRYIETVTLEVVWDPNDLEDVGDAPDPEAAITMWEWVAYSLFSDHACPNVGTIAVNAMHLDQEMLTAIEQIVEAENPLAELFETEHEDEEWISASRFRVQYPETSQYSDSEASLLVTQQPQRVRVIDTSLNDDILWWRVLLPGYGQAWVTDADTIAISPSEYAHALTADETRVSSPQLHLKFDDVYPSNAGHILTLLDQIRRDVVSIDVETGEYVDDGFDMTYWTMAVLRQFHFLERLKFNCFAEIQRLSIFAESAESRRAELRSLTLNQTFYTDSTDILEFLTTLSDMSHPLTGSLEELDLTVLVSTETPFEEFASVWRRMLQRNRTLHTVSLCLFAAQCVDDDDVASRSRPLPGKIKMAFLGSVQHLQSSDSACSRFDAGVIATIFAFAAPPRTVIIDFDVIGRGT